jgi:cytochrome c556
MKHIVFLILLSFVATSGFAQTTDGRRPTRARRSPVGTRAEAPKQWDKSSQSIFADDAFTLLGKKDTVTPPPPVPPKPAPQNTFDRTAVMKELEKAEDQLTEVLADEKRFRSRRNDFDKSIKVLVANAKTLVQDDSEYKDDDTYMDMARSLRAKAEAVPDTIKTAGYAGAGKAVGKLKQVCNDCHEKYR